MNTNTELLSVLDYLEREKGIDKEVLIQAVESSLVSAARKSADSIAQKKNISIHIDRKTGAIKALAEVTVVEKNKKVGPDEISIKDAKKTHPDIKIGDVINVEVTTRNFGRIAAQTAKQTIIQKIKEAERDLVYNEFKDRIGDITMGNVRRRERGDIIIDLGRTEAYLPSKEQCPGENYRIGDRIRAFVVDVKLSSKGPEIILSRTNVGLVKRLFELEVPEIAEGTVEIKGIVREPGFRTKIAVTSSDPRVDPIGACVGMRGSRVKNIVRELENEKLDIIKWEPELRPYLSNTLNPAKLDSIIINEEEKKIKVMVHEDQLSVAIGKRGQNVRLASKLLGWSIDIRKVGEETEETAEPAEGKKEKAQATAVEEKVEEKPVAEETPVQEEEPAEPEEKISQEELAAKMEIPAEEAEALLNAGLTSLKKIASAKLSKIAKIEIIKKDQVKAIKAKAAELLEQAAEEAEAAETEPPAAQEQQTSEESPEPPAAEKQEEASETPAEKKQEEPRGNS